MKDFCYRFSSYFYMFWYDWPIYFNEAAKSGLYESVIVFLNNIWDDIYKEMIQYLQCREIMKMNIK